VSRHLENKPAIAALVKQLILREPAGRQAAQDERPRIEAKRVDGLLPVLPDQLNPLCLFDLLFRYDQVWASATEYGCGRLKTRVVELRQNDHVVTRSRRVVKASFGGSK
jgi:hypothetical protein